MRIARTMQVLGYALYAIAGLEPALDPDVHLLRHRAWLAAYIVLGIALHVGASADARLDAANDLASPVSPRSPLARMSPRARRLASLGVMTPAMITMAALTPCN